MKGYITFAALVAFALGTAEATLAVSPSQQPSDTAASPAVPAEERWPMPVEQFLAGKHLRRSDIVLTRHEYNLTSYIIRWATKSPFSHAALVFTSPQVEPGIRNTFVIEASSAGVDLTNLRDYIDDKSSFIAVKRLEQPWFETEQQDSVRGGLLDNIKSEYNYWAIVRFARKIAFPVVRMIRKDSDAVPQYKPGDIKRPNEFICSGFVQLGFVDGIIDFILHRKLPPWTLNEVLFSRTLSVEGRRRLPSREEWEQGGDAAIDGIIPAVRETLASELESVTPRDLAASRRLKWVYVIKENLVYQVSSYEDVQKLLP